MDGATVSVVIPVYNAHSTLRACLDSVLGQSHSALEVLCVNDGSTDDSLDILREYERRDARVRVFSVPNGGVSAARNLAIQNATGTYLQFLDSDDSLPPDATERMLSAITGRGCELAIAPFTMVMAGRRTVRAMLHSECAMTQEQYLDRLSRHPNAFYFSVLWNKLYLRDIVAKQGILCDTRLPWGEDFAFNARYCAHVRKVAVLSQPVYDYNRHMGGLTGGSLRLCLSRPTFSVKVRLLLYDYYKRLFREAGLYERFKRRLPLYIVRFTLNN